MLENLTIFSDLFGIAAIMFILANISDVLSEYRQTRAFFKHKPSKRTDNIYQILIIGTLIFCLASSWNSAEQNISTSLLLWHVTLLLCIAAITRALAKFGLLCREMCVRWHIFGN